jgi:hypothetical protein
MAHVTILNMICKGATRLIWKRDTLLLKIRDSIEMDMSEASQIHWHSMMSMYGAWTRYIFNKILWFGGRLQRDITQGLLENEIDRTLGIPGMGRHNHHVSVVY